MGRVRVDTGNCCTYGSSLFLYRYVHKRLELIPYEAVPFSTLAFGEGQHWSKEGGVGVGRRRLQPGGTKAASAQSLFRTLFLSLTITPLHFLYEE